MSTPDTGKMQMFREHLRKEWTDDKTIAAWRKWHAHIAHFTRPATDGLLETAQIQPGMRVLDLASGVGDPALSLSVAVGPSGHVTATDFGPGMLAFAEEQAKTKGLTNIEFRQANAESLPFSSKSFDRVTCRFGIMFFPDVAKALRECLRVLKPGGRATFVAWGKKDQPFLTTTVSILLKYVEVPPPDPDAPNAFMYGERDRLRRTLEAAGFRDVREEVRSVPGRWMGTPEKYWQQFSEVAAPFRPLIEKLTPEARGKAVCEILAELGKFWDGKNLTMPLEIVIGTGRHA
ncbi:MAG: class I SAM-dependent methyltransferase [Candidatus Acidiferrales bacterium]